MKRHLKLPSKTFLVGEYGALSKGPALLLNTLPLFQFQNGQFSDPHQQKGGFGASSAQWLCHYLSNYELNAKEEKELFHHSLNKQLALKIRDKYQKDIHQNDKIAPSGVDILSQCVGQVAHIDIQNGIFKALSWPFKDLSFLIFSTGNKTLTHQYLQEGIDLQSCVLLAEKSQKVIDAFCNHKKNNFLETLKEFDRSMESLGFCCQETIQLKKQIKKHFPEITIKGCGALGMDTLLIICESHRLPDIKSFAQKNISHKTYTNDDLTDGILMDPPY